MRYINSLLRRDSRRSSRSVSAPTVMSSAHGEQHELPQERVSHELPRFVARPQSVSESAVSDQRYLNQEQLHQFYMMACLICRWPISYYKKAVYLDSMRTSDDSVSQDLESTDLFVKQIGDKAMRRCRRRHVVASQELIKSMMTQMMASCHHDASSLGSLHVEALKMLQSCLTRLAELTSAHAWPKPKPVADIATDVQRYLKEYLSRLRQSLSFQYVDQTTPGLYFFLLNASPAMSRQRISDWSSEQCQGAWVLDLLLLVCMPALDFKQLYKDGVNDVISPGDALQSVILTCHKGSGSVNKRLGRKTLESRNSKRNAVGGVDKENQRNTTTFSMT
jgi:hypothetical protein